MIDINQMALNIKGILATVPGIKQAYDHEPQNMSQFPAATLYFDGFGQTEETTRRNSLDWRWTIRLYTPLNVSDIKIPQERIRTLLQDTINTLRKDVTLKNSCMFHTVDNGEIFALFDQNQPCMIAELSLVARTSS